MALGEVKIQYNTFRLDFHCTLKPLNLSLCILGVLLKAGNYVTKGHEFKPKTGNPATTCGESCASSTCPMIVLRVQPTGSRAQMVFNYSHCVVLGFGPA